MTPDQQRQHYEYAAAYRAKYHAEKRKCNHKKAELYRREFEYHAQRAGVDLDIRKAA